MNYTDRFFITFLIIAIGLQPLKSGLTTYSIIVALSLFFSLIWEFYSNRNIFEFFGGLVK